MGVEDEPVVVVAGRSELTPVDSPVAAVDDGTGDRTTACGRRIVEVAPATQRSRDAAGDAAGQVPVPHSP
jgi:hypothetical protein